MQTERQFSSWVEREVPGLGMQRSKQCSFSLLIRFRALFIAVSAWTCLMKAFFSSSESEVVVEGVAEEDDRELPKKEGIMGGLLDLA